MLTGRPLVNCSLGFPSLCIEDNHGAVLEFLINMHFSDPLTKA